MEREFIEDMVMKLRFCEFSASVIVVVVGKSLGVIVVVTYKY